MGKERLKTKDQHQKNSHSIEYDEHSLFPSLHSGLTYTEPDCCQTDQQLGQMLVGTTSVLSIDASISFSKTCYLNFSCLSVYSPQIGRQ